MLPPGFTFRPSDQDLVVHFLLRWIHGLQLCRNVVQEADVYAREPEALLRGRQKAYFFTTLKPSGRNLSQVARRAGRGTWTFNTSKQGDPIKLAVAGGYKVILWFKRHLSFHLDNAKNSTGFVMDEFARCALYTCAHGLQGQKVLCVIRQTQRAINDAAKRKRRQLQTWSPPPTPAAGVRKVSNARLQKLQLLYIFRSMKRWGLTTSEEEAQLKDLMHDPQVDENHPTIKNMVAQFADRASQLDLIYHGSLS
ncbi:hypothetical protein MUK42_02268 [Musa troglodytarum]|uniref:NAC domain-containing protein n=1 Tax=Musa troglodytarum TaxID=320322 RepID=A0A9E7EHJ2_9LILI|nr:hypothetical protein MUK42_02268 [Musa troglodytarum]